METQDRTVAVPGGTVRYLLERKRVKNWNLRVRDGRVHLSVPPRVTREQADRFVQERAGWIARALARQETELPLPEPPPRQRCMELLSGAVERMLPLIAPLGIARPQLKLRAMRTQWGNCHWRQGYITLNTALASCAPELQDYVALHELTHFLHPDHSRSFYAVMDRLMPDWRERRRRLKQYRLG